jgi:hypothetical protein
VGQPHRRSSFSGVFQRLGAPFPTDAARQRLRADWRGSGAGGFLRRSGTVSGLSSASFHLLLLLLLGLSLRPNAVEPTSGIQVLAGRVAEVQPLDSLVMAPIVRPVPSGSAFPDGGDPLPAQGLDMPVAEPSLVSDLGRAAGTAMSADPHSAGATGTSESADGNPATAGAPLQGSAEFFGVTAYGNNFVYLLDMSTSMSKRSRYGYTRFEAAASELMRSVGRLNAQQKFLVILFSYRTRLMMDSRARVPRMLPATKANKQRLRTWLGTIQVAPGTDPRLGVLTALKLQPDAIFLLSDGEFNGRRKNLVGLTSNPTVEKIVAVGNDRNTPINTVAFADQRNRDRLRRLSEATGGSNRFVSGDMQPDLAARNP